jgi:hypothetical protein
MSHLNLETLARLLDDAPDPTEAGHLDICEQCRTELEALRADAAALRQLPDPQPPIAAWVALEQRLEREGLLQRAAWWSHPAIRAAAVFVVFVLGSVVGGLVMRRQTVQVATSPGIVTSPLQRVVQQPLLIDSQPSGGAAVMVATPLMPTLRPAATPEEAATRLQEAERNYLSALTRYAEFNGRAESNDAVARLAALESIVATTRAALGQAPADPVINGYHMTAVAQRDATLKQLAASGQTWY